MPLWYSDDNGENWTVGNAYEEDTIELLEARGVHFLLREHDYALGRTANGSSVEWFLHPFSQASGDEDINEGFVPSSLAFDFVSGSLYLFTMNSRIVLRLRSSRHADSGQINADVLNVEDASWIWSPTERYKISAALKPYALYWSSTVNLQTHVSGKRSFVYNDWLGAELLELAPIAEEEA